MGHYKVEFFKDYFNILYHKIEYEMWGVLLNLEFKINKLAFGTFFAKCSPLDSYS